MLAAAVAPLVVVSIDATRPLTLWFDEATFFVNARDAAWFDLVSRSLPYYDQASPPGYTALVKILYELAGLREWLLRLPSLLAYFGIFWIAVRFPGLGRMERTIFALAILCSNVLLLYSFQVKHYVVEQMFTLLLLRELIRFADSGGRSWRDLLVASCVALPFVVAMPVLLVAAASILGVSRIQRTWRCRATALAAAGPSDAPGVTDARTLWPALLTVVALSLAFHASVVRNTLAPLANYRYALDFGFADGFDPGFYVRRPMGILISHYLDSPLVLSIITVVSLVGVVRVVSRGSAAGWLMASIPLAVLTLNIAGLFPLLPGRHSLVLLPSIAYVIAVGTSLGYERFRSPAASVIPLAVVVCLIVSPLAFGRTIHGQQSGKTVAFVREMLSRPAMSEGGLLVTLGSEPILDAYLGESAPGWAAACGATLPTVTWTDRCSAVRTGNVMPDFQGQSTQWYLMNYIAHASGDGRIRPTDVSGHRIERATRDYLRFLRQSACQARTAIIASVHLGSRFRNMLVAELERSGHLETVLDENRSAASSDGSVWRFVRRDGVDCSTD